MDFGALPPEINSVRIYTGPGPGPLLAAATAWDGLAAELEIAGQVYGSVIAELTAGPWLGPAALSMAAAAAPYVAWMSGTAEQAAQAAAQAKAAAAAFDAVFAATVPPALVAANRTQLMTLVATNFFGQNTPAIAATEAHYAVMWAQDAAAMFAYAGASASASAVAPFNTPPPTTNQAGIAVHGAATAHAAGSSAQTTTSQLLSTAAVPQTLQQLTSSGTASGTTAVVPPWLQQILDALTPANRTAIVRVLGLSYFTIGTPRYGFSLAQQLLPGTPSGAGGSGSSVLAPGGWGPPLVNAPGLGGGAAASMGQASTVGRLSVPSTWADSAPRMNLTGATTPLSGANAGSGGPAALLRGMPLAGAGRQGGGVKYRYGFRNPVLPRPPAAG